MRALVRCDREQGLAVITLDAPHGNAINLALAEQLRDAVRQCHDDREIRAVLVQATGKTFCAGGDLDEFRRERGDRARAIEAIANRFHEAESLLLKLDVPVIIAVQGAAAGAGLTLALLGDVIIASDRASFVPGFARLGLSADGGSTWALPRLIGTRRTAEWLLTGKILDADQALAWGLVSEVCGAEDLAERAGEIARRLATGPTPALRSIKRLIGQSLGSDFESQAAREARAIAHHAETPNGEEGISALLEGREPRFVDAAADRSDRD
ncbi:MAG: enoyl-CoA hydratase-related protein [Pseudomonadota bacterium]